MNRMLTLVTLFAVNACSIYAQGNGNGNAKNNGSDASAHETLSHNGKSSSKSPGALSISYRGGPVMSNGAVVYYIWYGNWSGNSATAILTDLANTIGGSPYFNINTTYYQVVNSVKTSVPNSVVYGGSTTDAYSQGTSLDNGQIWNVVTSAILSGRLPLDANGVYFVLTSADVTASSGFCSSYCGWHTWGTISNVPVKFSFVGNPDRCPSACSAQTKGPNGNAGADGMASILAHELEESATDPQGTAWYDNQGFENGDKCAWNFGATYTAANGAMANMRLGNRDFLIQQNWNGSTQACSLKY